MVRIVIAFFSIFFSVFLTATAAETTFIEGKDYVVLQPTVNTPSFPANKINVTEFFNYGCPACYGLEATLQKWLKKKPANVQFERIPVVFERHWDIYARAFYVAQALGVEGKMTPLLFYAIQEENQRLGNESGMVDFFVEKGGVDKALAESAFERSPTLDADVKQGERYMQSYQFYVIPTIVVNGKYKTDLGMAQDQQKMMDIVSFLVEKARH